jgi:hypothetical protein
VPHALVEGYIAERDQLLNTVSVLKNAALDRGGDPSDADLETMSKAYARIDRLDELIAVVGEDRSMNDETRDKLLRTPTAPEGGVKYRSGGEMVWDCLHANFGSSHDINDQEAKRRWDTVMKRAAQHMGTVAAETTPVAGDVGGLYVVPVVGPVISLFPQGQPFLSAVGRRPAPDAMNFTRPRIVDPDFATGVAPQNLQKGELVSKKFDVKTDPLSLGTVGGYLNVSQQLMSLQPSGWDIIVSQLQARLAWAGEAALVAEVDQTGAEVPLAAGADAPTVIAALFEAARLVYQNTKGLPTWIAYGPAGWAMLGSLCDAAGRPLFPFLGAANAMGTASLGDFTLGPLGLQQVVTPGITDTTIYVGNSLGVEAYVYSFPILEAVEPALLGRQVAVAEALCFYRPTTKEATTGPDVPAEANGVVKVGP